MWRPLKLVSLGPRQQGFVEGGIGLETLGGGACLGDSPGHGLGLPLPTSQPDQKGAPPMPGFQEEAGGRHLARLLRLGLDRQAAHEKVALRAGPPGPDPAPTPSCPPIPCTAGAPHSAAGGFQKQKSILQQTENDGQRTERWTASQETSLSQEWSDEQIGFRLFQRQMDKEGTPAPTPWFLAEPAPKGSGLPGLKVSPGCREERTHDSSLSLRLSAQAATDLGRWEEEELLPTRRPQSRGGGDWETGFSEQRLLRMAMSSRAGAEGEILVQGPKWPGAPGLRPQVPTLFQMPLSPVLYQGTAGCAACSEKAQQGQEGCLLPHGLGGNCLPFPRTHELWGRLSPLTSDCGPGQQGQLCFGLQSLHWFPRNMSRPGLSSAYSPTPSPSPVQTQGAPGFIRDIWDKIPLPRWVLITILVGAVFLLASCLVCIVCCWCRRRRRKKGAKKETVGLGGAPNATNTHLVQPDVEDVELGLEDPNRGRVQVSLEYSFRAQELRVGLKQAADLKALRASGTADAYARIYLTSDPRKIHETKVHRQTLSPIFNESCIFQVSQAELPEATLVIQVLDFSRFSQHAPIGEVLVPLDMTDLHHVLEQWHELGPPGRAKQEQTGELCFSLRYVPSTGKLTVVVLEARGLRQGLSESYVKVQLLLNRKKWKKKTAMSVKSSTASPYFNTAFVFSVPFGQIQNVDLLVSVWGHSRGSRAEPLGKLLLGCRATGHQLHHWSDMLAHARRPIAQWHRLQPPEEVDKALWLKRGLRLPLPRP
ncbi:synaptotagmin-8 [Dromiciops gliroides]|uniref:synaptotagmin-8 n=1 Tax=Dromiciops gliroides TaxID=33562 RepID=UPI001CC69606|nr:synaptotagmin-8 [Dromiciops gliroides]